MMKQSFISFQKGNKQGDYTQFLSQKAWQRAQEYDQTQPKCFR